MSQTLQRRGKSGQSRVVNRRFILWLSVLVVEAAVVPVLMPGVGRAEVEAAGVAAYLITFTHSGLFQIIYICW
jgi:hypothetical protein